MSEQLDRYIPSELDDEVEVCLAFEVASLEAELEAMERIRTEAMAVGAYFRYGPLLDALAAAQEEE